MLSKLNSYGGIIGGAVGVEGGVVALVDRYANHTTSEAKKTEFNNSDDGIRAIAQQRLSTASGLLVELGSNPLIENERLEARLSKIRPGKLGGVKIFYGPPGSGKSTYVRQHVAHRIERAGYGGIFCELKDSSTRATLGIPRGKELNAFVPKHSLLVFDQVENESLDETTGKYVRSLAT
jgi:hypothetical protein